MYRHLPCPAFRFGGFFYAMFAQDENIDLCPRSTHTKDLLASFNERINTIAILVMWTVQCTLWQSYKCNTRFKIPNNYWDL